MKALCMMSAVGLLALGLISPARAQSTEPSGRLWVVDQQNPQADDKGRGTTERPFKTIAPAAEQAQPGDTVRVKPGVYRERIAPARGGEKDRPITYQADSGGKVIVKGSEVWSPDWQAKGDGLFFATFAGSIFAQNNPFLQKVFKPNLGRPVALKKPPADHSLGQLFVDGKEWPEVKTPEELAGTPCSWRVDPDGKGLLIHAAGGKPPAAATVETSVRYTIFAPHRRGLAYINVRGFVFEHCANPAPLPQYGAISTRSGINWIIENNVVRYAKSVGIDCGSESWVPAEMTDTEPADRRRILASGHLIRGNTVSDCGICGITGWNMKGVRVIGNIVQRNNTLRSDAEEEHAGMKFHACDVLIEGNLVRDNVSWGIWLDNSWDHSRVTRNLIVNNGAGGVFLELGKGPGMVDHNLIGLSHRFGGLGMGYGIYTHDSSAVTIANNLIWGNAAADIYLRTLTTRTFHDGTGVQTSGERIMNNLLIGSTGLCLPYPNPLAQDNRSDWNVLTAKTPFAVNWNRVPAALRTKAEANSSDSWEKIDPARWQAIQSVDVHSLMAPDMNVLFDPKALKLDITVPESVAALRCPPVGDDRVDLLDNPYPPGDVPPGPIAILHAGKQTIAAWPIVMK